MPGIGLSFGLLVVQEFALDFETDDPSDFLVLVSKLRDTPIFTCIRSPLKGCLDVLG